jgi:VWFA-related protein
MKRMQTALFMLLAVAAAGLAPPALHAQNAGAYSGARLNQAMATVTVTPRRPGASAELSAADVRVYENGQRRPVLEWQSAKSAGAPLDLAILMDDSLSSNAGSQLSDLRQFVLSQPAGTRVGIAYGTHGNASVLQSFTTDHQRAAQALRLPVGRVNQVSSIYRSLADLVKHWPESGHRRAVLVVTDGIDLRDGAYESAPGLNSDLHQAIAAAQRAGVAVYTIFAKTADGYDGNTYLVTNGQSCLGMLASQTGGQAYLEGLQTPLDFAPYLQQMRASLARQYLLTYAAQPGAPGYRNLRVTTEQPNVKLAAPAQVYVPAG